MPVLWPQKLGDRIQFSVFITHRHQAKNEQQRRKWKNNFINKLVSQSGKSSYGKGISETTIEPLTIKRSWNVGKIIKKIGH